MSMWPGQFLQLATAALLVDEKLSRSRGVKKVFQLKFSLSWNCSACCFHSVKQNLEICDGFIMTDINKKKCLYNSFHHWCQSLRHVGQWHPSVVLFGSVWQTKTIKLSGYLHHVCVYNRSMKSFTHLTLFSKISQNVHNTSKCHGIE